MINLELLDKKLAEKGINQKELAEKLNLNKSSISSWKRGIYPQVQTLIEMCKILDVSADKLLGIEPTPPEELTQEEKRLIQYYQLADDRGKEIIMDIAHNEFMRNTSKERLLNLEADKRA